MTSGKDVRHGDDYQRPTKESLYPPHLYLELMASKLLYEIQAQLRGQVAGLLPRVP